MKIEKVELAWLAGVIDSDGCIGLYQYKPSHGYNTIVTRPSVTIVNTNELMIRTVENIAQRLNISYYCNIKKWSESTNWKDCYSIAFQNKESALKILEESKNYLVIKKEQADIVIEFCKNKKNKHNKKTKLDDKLYKRIRILNKKGNA